MLPFHSQQVQGTSKKHLSLVACKWKHINFESLFSDAQETFCGRIFFKILIRCSFAFFNGLDGLLFDGASNFIANMNRAHYNYDFVIRSQKFHGFMSTALFFVEGKSSREREEKWKISESEFSHCAMMRKVDVQSKNSTGIFHHKRLFFRIDNKNVFDPEMKIIVCCHRLRLSRQVVGTRGLKS